MRAWNSYSDDLTLKDGSVVKEYTIRFKTTEYEVYKQIEKFFQRLMDEQMGKCYKCRWWNYSYGCQNKKGICEFEPMADRKTESSSEKPNNCEAKNYCDDCLYTDTCDSKEFFYACTSKATISKMEQVDKDINVRSRESE